MNQRTKYVITQLVNRWNVGIKNGYIKPSACTDGDTDREMVIKYLKSVDIVAYLWGNSSGGDDFTMIKISESDNIRNPLDDE